MCRVILTRATLDIAPRGIASQSSLSRWSKPDDPQRAVKANTHEYAFHTDREHRSWWQLELDKAYTAEAIIISNRRNPKYLDVSSALSVQISNGDTWQTVYEGNTLFGYEPHSPPLIIPLEPSKPVKILKITSTKSGYLHLSHVQLLCRREEVYPPRPLAIVSNRPDGLGERLKAMMNAMVAAEQLGTEFRFIWPAFDPTLQAFHAITAREDMFSEGFIERYGCEADEFSTDNMSVLTHAVADSDGTLKVPSHLKAFSVHQGPLSAQAPQLEKLFAAHEKMAHAFERIEFSAPLEQARQTAQAIPLPDHIAALHLRAGDIVYGHCRLMGRFTHKVVSYPISIALIQRLQKQKKSVLVFGQDADLSAYLKDKYKVFLASDLAKNWGFSDAQQALFEICLMSRCSEIFAGQSGFAEAAAQIGNRHISDPAQVFNAHDTARIILKTLKKAPKDAKISNRQRAFAAWSAINTTSPRLSTRQLDYLYNITTTDDPENQYYQFKRACELYKRGRYSDADSLLIDMLLRKSRSEWNIFRILTKIWPEGGTSASPHLFLLEAAANRCCSGASFAVACISRALKDREKENSFRQLFLSQRPEDMAGLDRYLAST